MPVLVTTSVKSAEPPGQITGTLTDFSRLIEGAGAPQVAVGVMSSPRPSNEAFALAETRKTGGRSMFETRISRSLPAARAGAVGQRVGAGGGAGDADLVLADPADLDLDIRQAVTVGVDADLVVLLAADARLVAERRHRRRAQVVVRIPVAVDVADEAFLAEQDVQVLARAIVDEHEAADVEAVDVVVVDVVAVGVQERAADDDLGIRDDDVVAIVRAIDAAAGRAETGHEADDVVAVTVDDRSDAAHPERSGCGSRHSGAGTQREDEGEDPRKRGEAPECPTEIDHGNKTSGGAGTGRKSALLGNNDKQTAAIGPPGISIDRVCRKGSAPSGSGVEAPRGRASPV